MIDDAKIIQKLALKYAEAILNNEFLKDPGLSPDTALYELVQAYVFALDNFADAYSQVKDQKSK